MKKIAALILFLCTLAIGLNYLGHQSVVNLGQTSLFTAPSNGYYFIQGSFSLPSLTTTGVTNSGTVIQVSKNGTTSLYIGSMGATGFMIPQVSLVSGDSIAMSITSAASVDQGINAIKGDVFFGNAF